MGAWGPKPPANSILRFRMYKIGTVCAVRRCLLFWRVLNVGGNWSNGSNAGLWYVNANSASSNSGAGIGARQLVYNLLRRLFHTAW